jgi:hypothetical protein
MSAEACKKSLVTAQQASIEEEILLAIGELHVIASV